MRPAIALLVWLVAAFVAPVPWVLVVGMALATACVACGPAEVWSAMRELGGSSPPARRRVWLVASGALWAAGGLVALTVTIEGLRLVVTMARLEEMVESGLVALAGAGAAAWLAARR